MTKEKNTIKLQSYFGEKNFTKEEYTKRWLDVANDLGSILTSGTSEDCKLWEQSVDAVKRICSKQFDEKLEEQNK